MKQAKKILSIFFCLLFCLNLSLNSEKTKADPATLGLIFGSTALGLGILNTGLGLFNARTKVSRNDLNYRGNGYYGMPPGATCCCPPSGCSPVNFVQQRPIVVTQQVPVPVPVAQSAFAAVPSFSMIRPQATPTLPVVRQQAFQPVRGLW